jgi:TatD DNase family protein
MKQGSGPYINVHTHRPPEENCISVFNAGTETSKHNSFISVGIHPWYINDFNESSVFDELLQIAGLPQVLAIGECGLDKNAKTSLDIQEHFFREQISIAIQVKKPLIIHCVKAFNELIRIKKESAATVPFIVHGFNNNENIAKELIANGFILSFGKALLSEGSNTQRIVKDIAANSFFLETDDAPVSIMSIFEKAAVLRETSVEELKEQMLLNFKSVFKYG